MGVGEGESRAEKEKRWGQKQGKSGQKKGTARKEAEGYAKSW